MCLYWAFNKVLFVASVIHLFFVSFRYFNLIGLESGVRITDIDPTLAYLDQNYHSRPHCIFISVYYVLFKNFQK